MGAKPSKLRIFYRKRLTDKNNNKDVMRRDRKCRKSTAKRADSATSTVPLLLNNFATKDGDDHEHEQQRQKQQQQTEDGEEGEEMILLGLCSSSSNGNLNAGGGGEGDLDGEERKVHALGEMEEMERELDTTLAALRAQLERLENEQRRKLQCCTKKWRQQLLQQQQQQQQQNQHSNSNSRCRRRRRGLLLFSDVFSSAFDGGRSKSGSGATAVGCSVRARKKLESMAEECRLRNALLVDKFRNCTEYLQGFDALIRSIQREQQKSDDDDDFLRDFLLKTAKRQHRKGQLSQAVDTFCQLLIATDGRLRAEEMAVLADVCREKVEHTREFHARISRVVRQQLDNSPFVVDELWGTVLEELRAECADAYEIVMRVRAAEEEEEKEQEQLEETEETTAGAETQKQGREAERAAAAAAPRQSVDQLKYLLGSTICALWLQITPYGHDEFDEVKELFFRTLDQYLATFRRPGAGGAAPPPLQRENLDGLENTVLQLLGQYPKLAGTKKMRKLAQRLFCGNGSGQNPAGEEPMAMVSRSREQQNRPQILVEY